jgi:hypothetical protein
LGELNRAPKCKSTTANEKLIWDTNLVFQATRSDESGAQTTAPSSKEPSLNARIRTLTRHNPFREDVVLTVPPKTKLGWSVSISISDEELKEFISSSFTYCLNIWRVLETMSWTDATTVGDGPESPQLEFTGQHSVNTIAEGFESSTSRRLTVLYSSCKLAMIQCHKGGTGTLGGLLAAGRDSAALSETAATSVIKDEYALLSG